jgi:hypothetical protein
MAEKPITLEPAEPVYILPPHPEARVVSSAKTVSVEAPVVADETLTDMVTQAVAGLRGELKAELFAEIKKETGGLLDAKNQELSID